MISAAPYLIVLASMLGLLELALRSRPAIGSLVLAEGGDRSLALDGARGVLALSVAISHELLLHVVHGPLHDQVELNRHPFMLQLGSASVALFFMISAYLFGGKLLLNGGRLDLRTFAVGRVRRIVPLYVFTVAVGVVTCFAVQGFSLVESWSRLLDDVARNLMFDFVQMGTTNGVGEARDMLAPAWSLRYEWILYAEIPLMAFLFRRTGWTVMLYVPLLLSVRLLHDGRYYFFVAGLVGAQLAQLGGKRASLAWAVAGPMALALLFAEYHTSMSWRQALLLIPVFVAVLRGEHWFALLQLRSLRFLGEISFSIYLMHMPVIIVATRVFAIRWVSLEPATFVATAIALTCVVLAVSTATFLLVERRFMGVGSPRRETRRGVGLAPVLSLETLTASPMPLH